MFFAVVVSFGSSSAMSLVSVDADTKGRPESGNRIMLRIMWTDVFTSQTLTFGLCRFNRP